MFDDLDVVVSDRRGFLGRAIASVVALASAVLGSTQIVAGCPNTCPKCGNLNACCCLLGAHQVGCIRDCEAFGGCPWSWGCTDKCTGINYVCFECVSSGCDGNNCGSSVICSQFAQTSGK